MTDQTPPEATILAALGIDPALVAAGTMKILWDGAPDPILSFTLVQRVPAADLAKAMSTVVPEETAEPTGPTLVPDEMSPEVKAAVNAELQRIASEKDEQ